MRIVRSLQAALAATVFAAGVGAGAPAWADRGWGQQRPHFQHHHQHGFGHHGHRQHDHDRNAWVLGALAGTALTLAITEPRPVYRPPVVVYAPPRVIVTAPPAYIEQGWWYYCAAPAGYYPYVTACATGWMRVAPLPPD